MISIYNKAIIREINPFLLGKLEKLEEHEKQQEFSFEVKPAKNGEKTILYHKNGKEHYLHSRYNPTYEAEQLLDSCQDITEESNLVVYGVGLGYHLKEVIKRFPNIKLYIVEPNLELLYLFLCHVELKDLGLKNLDGISNDLVEIDVKIPEFNIKFPGELKLLWLKNYGEYFEEEFKEFRTAFLRGFKNTWLRTVFFTIQQKKIVTNQLENIKYILKGEDLLSGENTSWQGKTAVIVAAGPSLDEEIENLRIIKEQKLAYIFAVGSAVNSLLSNGIHADGVFSYDPSERNQIVLQRIKDENIKDIPLFFGGGIGSETLVGYPGKMYHAKNASHPIYNFFLKEKKEVPFVRLGSTITVMALDAAFTMGFSEIILVGQNLGITKEKSYSSGISYLSTEITVPQQYSEDAVNVHGEEMKTAASYLSMRDGIEAVIRVQKGKAKVWNATKKGLFIKGAEFKELSELMKDMKSNSVDTLWQDTREKVEYDREYLQRKRKEIKLLKEESERQFKRMEDILQDIKKEKELGLYHKLPKLYTKLNLNLSRLEENKYSNLFILSAIIQEYHDLILGIERFNEMPAEEQAETIYQEFKAFLDNCLKVKSEIDEVFYEMDKDLERYCDKKELLI